MIYRDLDSMARLGTARAPHTAMIRRLLSLSLMRSLLAVALGLVISAGVAQAQRPVPVRPRSAAQSRESIVPPGFYPPAGMCRVWINGVPAGQQPAPTDCASAVRNRPANGKVLFGDDPPKSKKGKSDNKKSSPTDELVGLIKGRMSR